MQEHAFRSTSCKSTFSEVLHARARFHKYFMQEHVFMRSTSCTSTDKTRFHCSTLGKNTDTTYFQKFMQEHILVQQQAPPLPNRLLGCFWGVLQSLSANFFWNKTNHWPSTRKSPHLSFYLFKQHTHTHQYLTKLTEIISTACAKPINYTVINVQP